MQIANIYPVKNQELYKDENYVMILAHLIKKGLYKKENFNNSQYIIMDNGLYEEEQVSTNILPVIELAHNSGIPVKEIIVPDVVNNLKETIRLFEENLTYIEHFNHTYTFMFVAQATTYEELRAAIAYLNNYDLNLSVGISKLSPLDRASDEAIEIYKTSKHPIHFLGLKTTFKELIRVQDIIRGCDSSQLAYIAKNESSMPSDVLNYERKGRREDGRGIEGVDIDLEHDEVKKTNVMILKNLMPSFESKIEKYQKFVKEGASPKYTKELSIIGLVGEVGELADVVKKETIYSDMSKFEAKYGMTVKEKIKSELGDTLWQLTCVMNMYNISFDEVIYHNVQKLLKRHNGVKTASDGGARKDND